MARLRAARAIGAPDWYLAAGAVRALVWKDRFGPGDLTGDLDFVFFDPDDLEAARERALEAALRERAPDARWEAVNQAAVHLWSPLVTAPLQSTADGIAGWPETATCTGIRLEADESLTICAPHGLADLFAGVVRRNPICPPDVFAKRLREKRFLERWPGLKLVES